MDITKVVAQNVRRIRVEKNISQEKLASLCNFSRPCLERIERGSKKLKIDSIERIAKALKVPIFELLNEHQKDENNLKPVETLDMNLLEANKDVLLKNLVEQTKEDIDKTLDTLLFNSIVENDDSKK